MSPPSGDSQSWSDRDLRQCQIVPPERLATCTATIIGVGSIGRQVALQLAAMGVPRLHLVDPDTVEVVNLGCQGYCVADIGRPKVHATAGLCHEFNLRADIQTHVGRFARSMPIGDALFCCVDSIDARGFVWNTVQDRVDFFVDGRMAAEVLRVLVACDPASRAHYPATLFTQASAYRGACTAQSTIFCANIAAGLMIEQFARYLRRLPVDADLQFNLLSSELAVTPVE